MYQIINLLTAFINQIIVFTLVYLLSSEEFGYLSLVILVANIFFIVTVGWNDSLILNLGTKNFYLHRNIKNVFLSRSYMIGVSLLIAFFVFFIFKSSINSFIGNHYFSDLVIFYFLSDIFLNIFSNVFYARNNNVFQSLLNFTPRLLALLYLIFIYTELSNYIYFICIVNFAFFVIGGISFFFKEGDVRNNLSSKEFNAYLKFSGFQLLSVSASYIINWGDNFVLSFYETPIDQIGNYSFSYKIFLGFNVFFALANIMLPKAIYKYKKNKEYSIIKNIFVYRNIFILTLLTAYLISISILKHVLLYINKPDFLISINYLIMFIPAFTLMLYSDFSVPIIINSKHYKKIQTAVLLQSIINIISNFIFVYFIGLPGVIIGTTLSYLLKAVIVRMIIAQHLLPAFKKESSIVAA